MSKQFVIIFSVFLSILFIGEKLIAKSPSFVKSSPSISFDKLRIDYAGTENQFQVHVRGIKIVAPILKAGDTLRKAQIICDVRINENDVNIEGFSLNGVPSIIKEGDNYNVSFSLVRKSNSSGRITGKVNFKVGAIAIATVSGKKSKRAELGTEIDIDFRPLKK